MLKQSIPNELSNNARKHRTWQELHLHVKDEKSWGVKTGKLRSFSLHLDVDVSPGKYPGEMLIIPEMKLFLRVN